MESGLGILPYSPLANGLLSGKVRRHVPPPSGTRLADVFPAAYITDEKLDTVEALITWAGERGRSLLDVAIGGLASMPGCASVIAGATSTTQVIANVAAGDWVADATDLAELDELTSSA